jgi:hypothetical protein
MFDGLTREMVVKLVQAGLRLTIILLALLRESYKTDGAANKVAVEIPFAELYTVDFVLTW